MLETRCRDFFCLNLIGEDIYMTQESHPDGGSAKHPGLRLTESGKWGVQIYHSIQRKMKWFGTYNTIEEAINVYEKSKLEIALQLELANATKSLDVDCNLERANNTPHVCAQGSQSDCKSYKGVREKRPGRWTAEIKIPFKRKSVYLGTFNTPEEAADAYAKKRREFDDTMTALGKKQKCKGGAGENSDSTAALVSSQDSQGSHTKNVGHKKLVVDANCAKGSGTCCESYKGVRQKRPGRWTAEIKDPFKRRSVYLGSFNNPEEAADAFAKKRREFDAAFAKRRREFDAALMALGKKQQGKGEAAENSNSTVTAVSSQDSRENNCTEHAEDEFGVGVGVINSYGQLIGEYSRIDDDLWLTGL